MDNATPLYQLDPTARFSNRADDYAKYRPTYPDAAIKAILADLKVQTVADIGAGTGISSRLLADLGFQVWAVEPNQSMGSSITPHPNITVQIATAETTGLADNAVDLVTAFQAFHWFQPDQVLSEFHRILKSTGRLAIVFNDRDGSDACTRRYGETLQSVSDKPVGIERMVDSAHILQTSPLFNQPRQIRLTHQQMLDLAGLMGLARSRSYTPAEGTTAYEILMQRLTVLHQQFADQAGLVAICYVTNIFLAEPSVA
jgi:SAM-dependent methyltransferase